jgi:hypothetical protein
LPEYRIYVLDGSGRFVTAEWVAASSDDEAIAAARGLDTGLKAELWHGSRLVARFGAGAAEGVSDGAIPDTGRTDRIPQPPEAQANPGS